MRLGASHHALAPPVPDHGLRWRCARPVVAIEGTTREIEIELRAVRCELSAKVVEYFDGQAARIGLRFQHQWRYGTDENQLGRALPAIARNIARGLSAAGGMTNVNGIAKIKLFDDRRYVGCVVIHVVAIADRGRTTVTATIMGDDTITLADEEEHLGVPVVGAQRPTMVENNWLGGLRPPIFVEDLHAIPGRNGGHEIVSLSARFRCIDFFADGRRGSNS